MENEKWPKHFNKSNEYLLAVQYDITLSCNNRCSYCCRLDLLDNKKLFNKEIFDEVIKQTLDFTNNNTHYITHIELLGGDPLVVIDETIEFIKKLQHPRIKVTITTNLNFNPEGETIQKLLTAKNKYNFELRCSWHESSNEDWLKTNVKTFEDILKIAFLMSDTNYLKVNEIVDWALKNTIVNYEVTSIRLGNIITYTDYESEIYKKIRFHDRCVDTINDIDGKILSKADLFFAKNISKSFRAICKFSHFDVKFDGRILSACEYSITNNNYHIKNGFPIKDVFCHEKVCMCDTQLYKKLYKK